MPLEQLAVAALQEGDDTKARALLEESLSIGRKSGEYLFISAILNSLGRVARRQGDLVRAGTACRECLRIYSELGNSLGAIKALASLSGVALMEDRPVRATKLLSAAGVFLERLHYQLPPLEQREFDADVAAARVALDEATFAASWHEGKTMTLDEAVGYALEEELNR